MRTLLLLCASAALLLVGGCDSGDPDDDADPRDVAGIYRFTEYSFNPSGTGFQPIDVLDTLNTATTELRLASDGDFQMLVQFVGGDLFLAHGTFSVTTRAVNLNGSDDDEDDFERLLLDQEFTLRRDPDQPEVLSADIPKTINPSAFSDRYEGVPSMSGTLRLRLVRE